MAAELSAECEGRDQDSLKLEPGKGDRGAREVGQRGDRSVAALSRSFPAEPCTRPRGQISKTGVLVLEAGGTHKTIRGAEFCGLGCLAKVWGSCRSTCPSPGV